MCKDDNTMCMKKPFHDYFFRIKIQICREEFAHLKNSLFLHPHVKWISSKHAVMWTDRTGYMHMFFSSGH